MATTRATTAAPATFVRRVFDFIYAPHQSASTRFAKRTVAAVYKNIDRRNSYKLTITFHIHQAFLTNLQKPIRSGGRMKTLKPAQAQSFRSSRSTGTASAVETTIPEKTGIQEGRRHVSFQKDSFPDGLFRQCR